LFPGEPLSPLTSVLLVGVGVGVGVT